MRRRVTLASLVLVALTSGSSSAAEPEALFGGLDLWGWRLAGGGTWGLADGAISSQAEALTAGQLIFDRELADCELSLEVKPASATGVGLLLRTHLIGRQPIGGYELPLAGQGAAAASMKAGEWNQLKLRLVGPTLTVTVNKDSYTVDNLTDTHGYLALVCGGDAGGQAQWRSIQLTDLGWGPGWQPLFNGRDLTGWTEHGQEQWLAIGGDLVGQALTDKYGYLATTSTWQDFEAQLDFRCIADGNSGFFFHSSLDGVNIRGVQAEISARHGQNTAGLYESAGRGWLAKPNELGDRIFNEGGWNTMRVRCEGNRTRTWLNGMLIVDLTDEAARYSDGVIALQLHSGGRAGVRWRNIWIRSVD